MDQESLSVEVELPSADLLHSAYQAVRPRLKPEDVPAAWKREAVLGTHANDPEGTAPMAPSTLALPPVVRMEERPLRHKKAASKAQGHSSKPVNPQKQNLARGKASARLSGGFSKVTAIPGEQRHERVIQHRDRSTTYTLGGPRCSRTDGKHWQCKREALPEQKYCEKHLHRGLLRLRKHKKGDGHQDFEGDFLFRGWQKDKPKLELWPGLCDEPPAMDHSPNSSQNAAAEEALLATQPPQHLTPEGSAEGPSTGPPDPLAGQWTPAQKQILKAAFSELGLDGQELFPGRWGSRTTAAEPPRGQTTQPVIAEPSTLPYISKPPLLSPTAPDILRVGQDQAVLPSTVEIVAGRDGNFTVSIPTASLQVVGISVKGDSLVSTWGPNVPIYLALGGSSELVKLEAVRQDGDAVAFKGRVLSEYSRPKSNAAIMPWDGPKSVADLSKADEGLDLALSLVAPSMANGKSSIPPKGRRSLQALPSESSFLGTGKPGRVVKPEPWVEGGVEDRYAPRDWRSNRSNGDRTGFPNMTGQGLVKLEWPSPMQRRPTGFDLSAPHQAWPMGVGEKGHHGGRFVGRNPPPGEAVSAGVLAGIVASVILQTPRGVLFEGGGQAEEMDMEGSTDERAVDFSRLPSASGGQVSQSGSRGGDPADSASSPLKENRKRGREDGCVDETGFGSESLDLALHGPGMRGKKSRGAEQRDPETERVQPFLGLGRAGVGADDERPGFRAWQEPGSALRARRGLDGSLSLATGQNLIRRSGSPSPSSFSPWTAVRALLLKNETAALEQKSRGGSALPLGGSPGGLMLGSPSLGSPDGRWEGSVRDLQGGV